jgi:hypothetical protein
VAVAFAVLPSLYENIAQGIDPSIRDRIERLGAQPVRLKPLSRPEVEALLERRLALLYDVYDIKPDPEHPLYPFEDWFVDELAGQTSRYVTEYVQLFQRLMLQKGDVPAMEDFPMPEPVVPPPPVPSAAAPGGTTPHYAAAPEQSPYAGPAVDYDARWDKFFAQHSYFGVPNDGSKQADLIEWDPPRAPSA